MLNYNFLFHTCLYFPNCLTCFVIFMYYFHGCAFIYFTAPFIHSFIFWVEEYSITHVHGSTLKRYKSCVVNGLLPTSVPSCLRLFPTGNQCYSVPLVLVTLCSQVRRATLVYNARGHHLYWTADMEYNGIVLPGAVQCNGLTKDVYCVCVYVNIHYKYM